MPLAELACSVLGEGQGDEPVFPGRLGRPLTGWSDQMRRFRAHTPDLRHFRLHDLRRTVRTGYGRISIAPHIGELALNHVLIDTLARTYDKGDCWPERIEAAERWAAHVAEQVGRDVLRVVAS